VSFTKGLTVFRFYRFTVLPYYRFTASPEKRTYYRFTVFINSDANRLRKCRLTVRWCEKVHHGAEMGVTVKGDGLNLWSRPRKGNVHIRPPLLCRVALSYASVAPTSSSKRRLDQLPSRCSIALVAFRVKIPELFTPVSPSIHYLLKHCLPLRTWPGVAPARYPPFTSCCLVVFRILHWNKLAASWTQNVSLQAELTNEKKTRSCHMFLVLWCFLALLGISKAGAMASSKQHQILSKGVPAESSTKRTPSDICIAL
jgi:hypothetical protein